MKQPSSSSHSFLIDTIYLVAYLVESDPLHEEAVSLIEREEGSIPCVSLLELDLILKTRGFSAVERNDTWRLLSVYISENRVVSLTPEDLALASRLEERLDYFDALVAAQAINRGMNVITTDESIKSAVSRALNKS